MGMKTGKKINRWIDLSGLPRSKTGIIRWSDAIGHIMNFTYGQHTGTITILNKMSNGKYQVAISTENEDLKYELCQSAIHNCQIGGAFVKPIAITHPDLVKYFVNPNEANKYLAYSGAIVELKCPLCGTTIKKSVHTLTSCGLACPMCSDGISYPNKLMFNILVQLGVNFKNEVTKSTPGFEWITGKHRYDFYVETKDTKAFIEMDGYFHTKENMKTYDVVHKSDHTKDELAAKHGIQVIRINCVYNKIQNRFLHIKTNILNSKINTLLDLSMVDWDHANNFAIDSNIRIAAQLWNEEDCCAIDVGKKLGVSRDTARGYLKIAANLGLCDYNDQTVDDRMMRRIIKNNKKKSKPIALYKNETMINVFSGVVDLDKQSKNLYGIHIDFRNAYAVCHGDKKQAYGYTMKFITNEEYERLLPQFSTIQN